MAEMAVCAVCRKEKPIAHFDARFIGKPVRITCAVCRGVPPEHADRWQDWRREQEVARATAAAERRRLEELEREARERARQEKQEEDERRYIQWRQHMQSQGYSDQDISTIALIHQQLAHAGRHGTSWADVIAGFRALQPPYIGAPQRRQKVRESVRGLVYSRQDGRCAYCERDLQPIDVWKPVVQAAMDPALWNNRVNTGIPVLEHRVPVSRGGGYDLDNLCYACRRCNQRKGIRTAEEFAAMPHDALTKLVRSSWMGPALIAQGILLEEQGYTGFAEGREVPVMMRMVLYAGPCPPGMEQGA